MINKVISHIRQFRDARNTRLIYRNRVQVATEPSQIVRGQPEDRVSGLEPVLVHARGDSVLDVGCHDGTVAAAFDAHGARFIDGLDLSPNCIAIAQNRDFTADTCFKVCDLAQGMARMGPALRRDNYDIVCYLAVHQHLLKQMSRRDLVAFEAALMGMARGFFTVRTSDRYMDDLHARITANGFEAIGEKIYGSVSPVRTYRRID